MTKGDLCELADIIGATLPRMGTKDAVADAVQKRLDEIKSEGLEKKLETPLPERQSKPPRGLDGIRQSAEAAAG
jgi:hypothetical protein